MTEIEKSEIGAPLLKLEGYSLTPTYEGECPPHYKGAPFITRRTHGEKQNKRGGNPPGTNNKAPRRRKKIPGAMDANSAAAMYALGISREKIVKILDLSDYAVRGILNRPEVREFATKVREVIRIHSLASIQQVNAEVYDWLNTVSKEKTDAKSFDYITRGLAALEKVASSSSGENLKVSAQVEHTVSGDLSEEAKALVKALIGSNYESTSQSRQTPGK